MSMYRLEKVRDKKLTCMLGLCSGLYIYYFTPYLKEFHKI